MIHHIRSAKSITESHLGASEPTLKSAGAFRKHSDFVYHRVVSMLVGLEIAAAMMMMGLVKMKLMSYHSVQVIAL